VLDAGADKVAVNSAAVARPELVSELGDVFGAQCVVLAIDAKRCDVAGRSELAATGRAGDVAGRSTLAATEGRNPLSWEVYVAGGRTPTGLDAVAWAREAVERGAGEILLTSMDRDGTSDGYDLALTRAVSEAVPVPVIASGGAGTLDHLVEALEGGADAALAASIFHFGTYSIAEAKEALRRGGIAVRA